MKTFLVIFFCSMLTLAAEFPADAFHYSHTKRYWYETEDLLVLHKHNWWGFRGHEDPRDCFSPEKNTYSYIELFDKKAGKRLWRQPCPAFHRLWISPDGKYIFGLSLIHVYNPYQLVFYDRSGKRLRYSSVTKHPAPHSQGMIPKIPNSLEAVSNYIFWFDHEAPQWALVKKAGKDYLEVNSRFGDVPKSENPRGVGYQRIHIAVLPEPNDDPSSP